MNPEISTAFTLLAIGMITVFVVLLMVVATGNLLIRVVNKVTPTPTPQVDNEVVAVLTAAVEDFTKGTGRITKIEKD